MSFVYNNLAALVVAAVVSVLGWLYGGTRSDVLADVAPWLLLFLVQALFLFPQKHESETTYEARGRVWSKIKKDPLVWTVLGLMALLAIPFVNNGLCVSCDRALIAQGFSPEPPIKFLPFCVNRPQHYNVFLWFALALSCLVVTKHALVGHGKRLLAKLIVWNGFALAMLGFIQTASGAQGPLWQEIPNLVYRVDSFFSTFGYPNMAGDYFTTIFGLSIALWRDMNAEVDRAQRTTQAPSKKRSTKVFWERHSALIPAGVSFFAAVSTLSRSAILLVCFLLMVCFMHALVAMTHRMHRKDRVKRGTIAVVVVALVAFFSIISMPDDIHHELDTLNTSEVLTRVTGKGQYHIRVATKIWRSHMLFGCGGWGYKHLCIPNMTPDEIKNIQTVGGINVHNDHLQFLTEHGLVGYGALLALIFFLIAPVVASWSKLVAAARFMDPKKAPPKPVQIFALPAPVFIVLVTALLTVIHGFYDCPLRSPAILTLFFVSLAILPGFLPKEQDNAAR